MQWRLQGTTAGTTAAEGMVYFRGQTFAKVWRVFTRFVIPPRLLSVGGGGRPAERLQLQSVRGPFLGLGSRNGVTAV